MFSVAEREDLWYNRKQKNPDSVITGYRYNFSRKGEVSNENCCYQREQSGG